MKGASVAWLLPVGITAIFAAWFIWSLPTTPRESSADWVAPLGVNPLGDDAQEYIRIAESVRTDGAYAYNGEPTRVRPPLYPLFLAAIQGAAGHNYLRYAQALQALFITMAVAVFYFIVRRVHGPRAGLVAAVVLGLFVPFAVRSALVMSEALFMLLLLLFLFWTLKALEEGRRRDYVLAGLAVGLAALARPAPILLPLVLVPLLLQFTRHSGAGRERLVSIGLFVAAFGVVLAPWGIRNAVTLGEFTVLPSSGGVNLWAASHQDWREFVDQHMAYALQLPEFHAIVGDDYYIDSEANERFRKVGLENIKADPFGWFGRNAAKLAFVAYEKLPPGAAARHGGQGDGDRQSHMGQARPRGHYAVHRPDCCRRPAHMAPSRSTPGLGGSSVLLCYRVRLLRRAAAPPAHSAPLSAPGGPGFAEARPMGRSTSTAKPIVSLPGPRCSRFACNLLRSSATVGQWSDEGPGAGSARFGYPSSSPAL